VLGLQKSVIASIKHFVAYEQETNRNPITNGHDGVVHSTSANLDDKTMHELYVWPFQDLIYAGAGSVMCSYNRINNTYACENSKAMNGILKGELNFQGFVVSDWAGQHSSLPSANAGLDMAMPNSQYWDKDQLARAVDSQTMNRTRLVDMATRVVATWYQFGQDDTLFPSTGVGMAKDLLAPHTFVDARDPASKPSLLDQAIQGHVLVKNVNNSLPLKSPKVLSVFGYDAVAQTSFDPGEGTFAQNWEAVGLQQQQFQDLASNSPVSSAPSRFMGTLIVGGGSGSNTPSYISTPFEALQQRAYQDDTVLFHDFTSTDPGVVATSDACLVFINEYASEAWDRPGLADQESDQLVKNVAAHCRNTIVVIHNAGTRLVDAWIDNKNVTAVIFAHLPGQEAGRSVVQLLYGDASPSGRLPYTVAKKASDYGSLLTACQAQGSNSPQCDFDEGVNIDYRSFLARGVTPRFAFGYGLTYSSFEYSNLQMSINATATPSNARSAPVYTNGTTDQNQNNALVGVAGLTSLFDNVGMITAMISNTGGISAAEVAQLYIQLPASSTSSGSAATRVLRGFNKVTVQPGSSAQVSFQLRRKDVSFWDTVSQSWVIPSGQFLVFVGKSVLDTPLTGSFTTT
jgi:beta-glucosidase